MRDRVRESGVYSVPRGRSEVLGSVYRGLQAPGAAASVLDRQENGGGRADLSINPLHSGEIDNFWPVLALIALSQVPTWALAVILSAM